jgi:hypothetical protein
MRQLATELAHRRAHRIDDEDVTARSRLGHLAVT